MTGAVVHQELLLGSRRGRLHVFCWIYAGWLLCQVVYFWHLFKVEERERWNNVWSGGENPVVQSLSAPQIVGGWFAEVFVWQQLVLLLLATPPLVAGAITDEKRRGTLLQLFTTYLESRQIVLGKLLARLVQVGVLASVGLPLFALFAGFAGIDPLTMLLVFVVHVFPLLGLTCAAVLTSALCRQTRDAVLVLYAVGALGWLVAWYVGGPLLECASPLHVLAPIWGRHGEADLARFGQRLLGSILLWGGLGGLCLGLAAWRMRVWYLRELAQEDAGKRLRSWFYGVEHDPVGDDPVRWREHTVEGLAPLPGLRRFPRWLGIVCISLATVVSSLCILWASMAPGTTVSDLVRAALRLDAVRLRNLLAGAEVGFLVQAQVVMFLASLIVGIRCSGAVTGERERGTWEALLLTPLSERTLLRGKLWGVMAASYWYLLAYAVPAMMLSVLGGVKALFWTGLWLAVTVLAMYYLGAAALWSSVRCRDSWRSLLSTLCFGYLGAVVALAPAAVGGVIVGFLIYGVLSLTDQMFGTSLTNPAMRGLNQAATAVFITLCFCLAGVFLLLPRWFLRMAQDRIALRERTRYWEEEPIYRRSRRKFDLSLPRRPRPSEERG